MNKKTPLFLVGVFLLSGCVSTFSSSSSSSDASSAGVSSSADVSSSLTESSSSNAESTSSSNENSTSIPSFGSYTLNSDNAFSISDGNGSFTDSRSVSYKVDHVSASSNGWFEITKSGLFTNTTSFCNWSAIKVGFTRVSDYGYLTSKASYYPITSPENGAFELSDSVLLSFSGDSLRYFSLYAPVGTFVVKEITLYPAEDQTQKEPTINSLDFYTINDTHGAAEMISSSSQHQSGINKLSGFILPTTQKSADSSIVVSSGDMWQGSADSNMTKGAVMVDWMNIAGFESMAIGNHEFDWTPSVIAQNAEKANFPFLGINIRDADNKQPSWAKSSIVVQRGKWRVGIIGAIGPVENSIAKAGLANCSFIDDFAPLVSAESDRLRAQERCDLVVLSVHYGTYNLSGCQNVDAVFEGHTHQDYETIDDYGIPHVQTYANGSEFQQVHFEVENGKLKFRSFNQIPFSNIVLCQDEEMTAGIYRYYLGLIQEKKDEVVGYTDSMIAESQVAVLAAKALYGYYRTDAWSADLAGAVVNTGCARQSIAAGDITYGDVYAALPFDNDNVLLSTSGAYVKSLMSDGYLTTWWGSLTSSQIDVSKTYTVMVISYVSEKDSYAANMTEISRDSVVRLRDIVSDYFRSTKNG